MKDLEIWNRFAFSSPSRPQTTTTRQLFVPSIAAVGRLPYELAGLLPNREHSRDLMALIDGLPENRYGHRAVVGVFAADPFLNSKRVAERLVAKKYLEVANIPPVAGYGAEFMATLDKVASGKAQEQRNIAQLVDRGLSVSPAVAAIDCLPAALAWSPRRLWVVPSFDMWREQVLDTGRLLSLCRQVADRTVVPIILAAGQTDISMQEAASAGARGILFDEGGNCRADSEPKSLER